MNNPQIFGWEHITYLAIFIVLAVVSLVLIKIYAKTEKSKNIIIKVVASILLITIIWNRISIAVADNQWHKIIPSSFCGMSSLVLSLACLIGKKNNNVLHYVVHVALVGDILTIFYPDFIGQGPSFLYSNTISGLLHHSIGLYLCILLYMTGYFTANYKKWPNMIIGFMAYITIGAFEMSVFGYNSVFYINDPILSGTPLNIWVIAPIFAVGYVLFFVIYEYIKKYHAKRLLLTTLDSSQNKEKITQDEIIDSNINLSKTNSQDNNYQDSIAQEKILTNNEQNDISKND